MIQFFISYPFLLRFNAAGALLNLHQSQLSPLEKFQRYYNSLAHDNG